MDELKYTTTQVNNIINRIEECFNILFPRLYNDAVDSSTSSNVDVLDDNFDDIDWIESDGASTLVPSSSSRSSSSAAAAMDLEAVGAVPYTLAFTLDTTAQDVTTADNDILISIVHELSKQLVNHVIPRLLLWKSTATKALDILSSEVSNGSGSSSHKRKYDDAIDKEAETRIALNAIKQLLSQVHTVLIRKCKELLKK